MSLMGMAAGRLFGFKRISSVSRKLLLRNTQSSSVNGRQSWGHMPSVSRKLVTKENAFSNMQTWNYIRAIWWDHFQGLGEDVWGHTTHLNRPMCTHMNAALTIGYVRVYEAAWGQWQSKVEHKSARRRDDEQRCSKWWMRRSFTSGNVRYVTGSLLDLSGSQRPLLSRTVKTHQLHSSSL